MVGAHRGTGIVALALVVAASMVAGAHAAPRNFYGVASQTFLGPREIDRMGDGGVGTLRSILSWQSVDPRPSTDDLDWSGFDPIVAESARNGIRVLPFIFGTPDWVAKDLDRRRCGGGCGIYAPRTAPARDAWREFVGAAVDRYGRGGEFWAENAHLPRQPITAWQIWNEQNSRSFYGPRPTVKGYAKLLDAAADAISARDRHADIVLGGMAELAGSRKAITASKYLAGLYRRGGVERDFDGIAPHPYGAELRNVRNQVGRLRDVAAAAGDRRTSTWITEIGWSSGSGDNPLEVGRRGQAQRLKEAYGYFEDDRRRLRIKNVTWFSWRDTRANLCEWCPNSGLFNQGLRPKPAWRAYRRVARG